MKLSKRVIRAVLRGARPPFGSRRMGVAGRRLMLELLTGAARPPKDTSFQRVTVAGVPVERVQIPSATRGTLVYLHGGAYALGSATGYRGLVAQLAAAAGMTAFVPDYSRAPEAQYPIALEEMVAVYSRLLQDGLDPTTTVIAGDSAGGGLTLALAMALRDRGIPAPAALGLICPWADLAIDIDGMRPVLRDPLILPSMCTEWAPRYVGSSDPRLPGISPVCGDMTGLPPIVMQTAGDDPISFDADKIETACAASTTAILHHRRFDDLWHDFHLQVSLLPEARDAVADLGAKLRNHLCTESPPDPHPQTKGRSQMSSFEGKVAVTLTRCPCTDVIPYPPIMHCATRAFAVGATAHAVFANNLAWSTSYRHTTRNFRNMLQFNGLRAYGLTALRAGFLPHYGGAPQAGNLCKTCAGL